MASHSGSMPYIKREPDELPNDPNRYMAATYQQPFSNNYNMQQTNGGIDPSALSMTNGNYGLPYSQQNLSSSYNLGNSGFGEDELLESLDFGGQQGMMDDFTNLHNQANQSGHPSGISMSHQGQMSRVYSSTPDGPPIQSPFLAGFDYNQFRPMNSIPQHMSPHGNTPYVTAKRPSMHAVRKSSDQRSPMTPKTPALNGLHIGTPDVGSLQSGRPIRTPSVQNRQQKTLSGHYDSTPGSLHSFLDGSPLSSPGNAGHHNGISETLGSVGNGSLPTKQERVSTPNSDSLEAKKKKRRASHNAVERRRRDNINERIQDLSHLVPQHRLDDDKIKKQLINNPSMSPSIGPNVSPPNAATSLLAGANGRRATSTAGNITLGLPIEDKEKGPNKGDILNGAVSWTRDLMWALNTKYAQEEELAQYITQLGGTWPFEITDEEKRMRSEVLDAMENNDATTFQYSRADGTGLRVPRHTNASGQRLQANSNMSPQSMLELSPGFHSGGSGTNSGSGGPGQPQFWNSGGHAGISFKEEDEDQYMDMN